MAEWQEAPDLVDLARRVIAAREDVSHVDIDEVLFLWEEETAKKARGGGRVFGECYNLRGHPIEHFTSHRYAVVFYKRNMDWMSTRQRSLLMWHELKHIPLKGDRLVNHDVQDFYAVLRTAGIDWADEGTPDIELPDITGEDVEEYGD